MANTNLDHEIDSLLETFQSAISVYRAELKAHGLPPLGAKEGRPTDDMNYVAPPKLYEAKRAAIASLGLINDALQSPFEKVVDAINGPTQCVSLQIMVNFEIPDLLARHSNTGLTIEEIAKEINVDPIRIGSPMRLLTSLNWFEELEGGKYKNNRFSEQLRKGCHAGNWCRAYHLWDKIWARQNEAITKWGLSRSPLHTATQLAHGSDEHFFNILFQDPVGAGKFIEAINALDNSVLSAVAADFPWSEIPANSTVCDVGGGAGSLCIAVAKKNPHLKFILQDQAGPIQQANAFFSKEIESDASLSGRLNAKIQNFFEPQTEDIRGDNFHFMMKWILHDWPEDLCVGILTHLANAAGPKSKIIIFEHLLQPNVIAAEGAPAKEGLASIDDSSPYVPIKSIPFVPSTFGRASNLPLSLSLTMNTLYNASERPLEVYKAIFDKAGLELVKVYSTRSWVSAMELRKRA